MDQGSNIKPVPSNNTPNLSRSAGSFSSTNPYQRDPSRRAIACVTCAKAKTRCDKAVSSSIIPACSALTVKAPIMLALYQQRHKMRPALHTPHNRQQLPHTTHQEALRHPQTLPQTRRPPLFERLLLHTQHPLLQTAPHARALEYRLPHCRQNAATSRHHVRRPQTHSPAHIPQPDRG